MIRHAGTGFGVADDDSGYGEPLPSGPDAALVNAIVDAGPKQVSSRTAMRQSMTTSPSYLPWACATRPHLIAMREAIALRDLVRAGQIAEHDALGLHAVRCWPRDPRSATCRRSRGVCSTISSDCELPESPHTAPSMPDRTSRSGCARGYEQRVVAALREVEELLAVRIAHSSPGVAVIGVIAR
ncbi:hypothetical protein [Nocardia sp. NPDC052316]|uniref:hypothetical protein n=1 Tax=Nocardia sp. NPDC052316 TaxID=3364329 RepID=UPI0037C6FD51